VPAADPEGLIVRRLSDVLKIINRPEEMSQKGSQSLAQRGWGGQPWNARELQPS
jgi:hypothetical protein